MTIEVDRYRAGLDERTLEVVDAIRNIVRASHAGLTETIKWNAPSFAVDGEHRVTLGIERKGGIRVVFHRGAKPRPLAGFTFDDEDNLARWPAPDRGVVNFRNINDVGVRAEALGRLCSRWISATSV